MKKHLALFCCFIVLFVFTSCAPQTISGYPGTQITPTIEPEPTSVPQEFTRFSIHIYNTFRSMAGNPGVGFYMPPKGPMTRSDNEGKPFYAFSLSGESVTTGSVTIYENTESIEASFIGDNFSNRKVDPKTVKSAIRAVILALDPGANSDTTDSIIGSLIDSYDGNSYSKIIQHKGYSFFIEPEMFGLAFYALKTDVYMNADFDKAQYKKGNETSIAAPLNKGESYFITGTVVRSKYSDRHLFAVQYVDILTDDNEYLTMAIQYNITPIEVPVGEKYVFYGSVREQTAREAVLWIDHVASPEIKTAI